LHDHRHHPRPVLAARSSLRLADVLSEQLASFALTGVTDDSVG
jgi:hypothetical protein